MADNFNIDIRGLDEFIRALEETDNNFRRQISLWFEALGIELLDIVQSEIIRQQIVDTRLLLNSFNVGGRENVFEFSRGGLTLEVGTNVSYARFVNDGHWTTEEGVERRFVPGFFVGDKFTYDPTSDTGMVLIRQWIEGRPYWDNAIVILGRIFEASLDRMLQRYLDQTF